MDAVDVSVFEDLNINIGLSTDSPLMIAKDMVTGYTGDYEFYRLSEHSYALATFDDGFEASTMVHVAVLSGSYTVGSESVLDSYTVSRFDILAPFYHVHNDAEYLVYSSREGDPHLISGGEVHAYTQNLLFVGIIAFWFIHSIFKRVI